MNIAIPFATLILVSAIVFACNYLALNPWRRSKDKHWSEQARLSFPVFVAARSSLFAFPAISALIVVMTLPDTSPLWFFTAAAAYLGAYLGTLPATREVHPRIRISELVEQFLVGTLLRSPVWILIVIAAVCMPDEPNGATFIMGIFAIAIIVAWARFGAWAARKIGMVYPASERLRTIAEATSTKMGVHFREVLIIRSPAAQALAVIGRRRLFFTERILELLPDDELAAICAHELAHLTESKWVQASRSIQFLTFLPWIFFKPVLHEFRFFGLMGLSLTTLLIPRIYRIISRKMESRADQMAKATEGDAGIYARALAHIYEDNLVPAVTSKEKGTHPHLYDRLLAAGVTPDFPRPIPAKNMALHGSLFAGLVGLLFALYALHAGRFFPPG